MSLLQNSFDLYAIIWSEQLYVAICSTASAVTNKDQTANIITNHTAKTKFLFSKLFGYYSCMTVLPMLIKECSGSKLFSGG